MQVSLEHINIIRLYAMGRSQVARHRTLTPALTGSNPVAPGASGISNCSEPGENLPRVCH